jgi:hypothetical protein
MFGENTLQNLGKEYYLEYIMNSNVIKNNIDIKRVWFCGILMIYSLVKIQIFITCIMIHANN